MTTPLVLAQIYISTLLKIKRNMHSFMPCIQKQEKTSLATDLSKTKEDLAQMTQKHAELTTASAADKAARDKEIVDLKKQLGDLQVVAHS